MKITRSICAIAALALSHAAIAEQTQTELFKVIAADASNGDNLGTSVAMSGSVAIVGAPDAAGVYPTAGAAYLFDVTTGQQLGKMASVTTGDAEDFGFSVAISGDFAVVGAPFADSGSDFNIGAAYLFNVADPANPILVGNLAPSGLSADDNFGYAVAMSGTSVVVGAPGYDVDQSNNDHGAVFVFDATTGQQANVLTADDFGPSDELGSAVAIDGQTVLAGTDTALIHRPFREVYVFDSTTGQQLSKLAADVGVTADEFGCALALDGDLAVVGARTDSNAGAVYVFDVADVFNSAQLAKIQTPDAVLSRHFGYSVGVDGSTVVVGVRRDDIAVDDGGAVFLYDASTPSSPVRVARLEASDAGEDDALGHAVAIDGTMIISGAERNSSVVPDAGAAYVFDAPPSDTDGDGLLDSWEIAGVPYNNSIGDVQRMPLPDADPQHKDLYVEIDAMSGFSVGDDAVFMIEDAFWASPLTNPDGQDGVTLHVLRDEADLPHVAEWATDGCWPLDFDQWRALNYGTTAERNGADAEALLEAKAKAYRYCIVADEASPKKIGGCGERPGDNSVIFIGNTPNNDEVVSAVLMHELGHNLGLQHGGGDGTNGKPNYPSIMNYAMSYKYPWNEKFWKLDFSRSESLSLGTLSEPSLNEVTGIGSPGGYYDQFFMPFGVNDLDGNSNTVRSMRLVRLDGSQTDFGDAGGTMFQDGIFDFGVEQDLNYLADPPPGISLPGTPSAGQTHAPHDDWGTVGLRLAAAIGAGAPAPSFPTDELTTDARDWIEANFPLPPGECVADVTTTGAGIGDPGYGVPDGQITGADINFYVNAWVAGDLTVADVTTTGAGIGDPGYGVPDGQITGADINYYVNLWIAGCP